MILKLLIKIVIVFILIKFTAIGLRPTKKYIVQLNDNEKEIAGNVKRIVKVLSLEIGARNYVYHDNLEKAAKFIIEQFKALGYKVETMPYELKGKIFKNIIAYHPDLRSEETIIIGAHYDSCFNPGADDNASGVAGLLELARLLKNKEFKSRLKFIAFVNEEPPFYHTKDMGSFVYANKARENKENIKAVIIMDLIGFYNDKINSQRYLPLMGPFYPSRADFIACIGNFKSRHIVKSIRSNFMRFSSFPFETLIAPSFLPVTDFSDHWSFWRKGFPAVLVTDTAFLRNNHYHKETDLPDTLDYNRMAVVINNLGKAILKFLNEIK